MLALLMLGCATQQEKAEQKAKMRLAVEEAIASKQMHIDIRSMSTLRYGTKIVTPDFYLELRGDTLRSYLPYLGQAQQSPMVSPSSTTLAPLTVLVMFIYLPTPGLRISS